MKLLFADNWHFHRRNFLPIFEALKKDSLPHQFETSRRSWWKAHGRYEHLTKSLKESIEFIDQQDDWSAIHFLGVNLWEISKAEFLCSALAQDRWHNGGILNQSDSIFEFAIANPQDWEALRLCLAAAHNWLLFWNQYLDSHTDISHAIVFSGSYIYTRALMVLAKQRDISVLVAEHFFTGNDFYLEYRNNPIANNCGVKRDFSFNSFINENEGKVTSSAYAHSRMKGMKNRNVPQTNIAFKNAWSDKNPIILIIGQVANDFSIIETPHHEISSIASYKLAIIDLLKNTNANVIFKAHPWERRRAPLFSPFTKIKIEEFIHSLPGKDRVRIALIENEPIQNIFQICDGVMGISSQGLLEACYFGFKPVLIGDTFFAKKGFTQSANQNPNLLNEPFDKGLWRLSLNEYEQFQDFMDRIFTEVLIPNSKLASDLICEKLLDSHAKLSTKDFLGIINNAGMDWVNLLRDMFERPYAWIGLSLVWIRSKFTP
ncbi:hypothetical protein VC159_05035 [Polynucleobacter sp. JS-JIR-II-c23]|uniref:capsular polysaccharide export protein, LipB/KpsS family n=1 Tax=Polynucleobacter sp. JS-JIR-II-c23 TaxID=1758393 RepID=UPI002B2337A7|nr:hypothetical protein [Polynucleobacter sp. JS-JIR-II-c23]MEA9603816.1 hypothetical protein [Polynucleobacter sp. JS-JIR-II-c23]